MGSFVDDLADFLGGVKIRTERDLVHAIVRSGESWFAVRGRTAPFAELFVIARPLDGFEATIRWGDRIRDPELGDPEFDAAFGLTTNDVPLMRALFDDVMRRAMFDSIYEFREDVELVPVARRRTWTYELRNDEIAATKGSFEHDPRRFATAIHTACAIAARAQRWAAEYAAIARTIDAIAAPEVQLGGEPVLTATRRAVELDVRLLRRAAASDEGRLRTVIGARRINLGGDTLSLVHRDLPRAARPELPGGKAARCDLEGYALRRSAGSDRTIDAPTRKLLGLARPGALVVGLERIELWFDGAMMDRERLDTGLELVGRWAVDGIEPSGPYR